jgi:membrane protein
VAAGTSAAHLSLRELVQRVWSELYADDVTGLAAEMSYYFVLSIFPFLIFLAALVGTLPFTGVWDGVLTWIVLYFPRQSQELVLAIVFSLTKGRSGFFSLGLIGTITTVLQNVIDSFHERQLCGARRTTETPCGLSRRPGASRRAC